MDREESSTPTCALNLTLIGMNKGNVLGFMRVYRFIHPDIFVCSRVSGFERTPCFSRKSKSLYMRPLESGGLISVLCVCSSSQCDHRSHDQLMQCSVQL